MERMRWPPSVLDGQPDSQRGARDDSMAPVAITKSDMSMLFVVMWRRKDAAMLVMPVSTGFEAPHYAETTPANSPPTLVDTAVLFLIRVPARPVSALVER